MFTDYRFKTTMPYEIAAEDSDIRRHFTWPPETVFLDTIRCEQTRWPRWQLTQIGLCWNWSSINLVKTIIFVDSISSVKSRVAVIITLIGKHRAWMTFSSQKTNFYRVKIIKCAFVFVCDRNAIVSDRSEEIRSIVLK